MPNDDPYLVFVSHSSKDAWIAHQMVRLIEERGKGYGVTTFLDEKDIEGGEIFSDEIFDAVERCDELVVLLSAYSVERSWVLAEIGAALGQRKRVVGIVDKIPFDDIPDLLQQRKAYELNDFEEYLDELESRVQNLQTDE